MIFCTRALGLALFLFFFAESAFAQGVVFLRRGYVQVNGRAIESGDPFRSGSVAVTEESSVIRVVYAESSFVHAGPKTKFMATATSENTMVTLDQGWVWVRAGADRTVTVSSGDAKVEAQSADFIFRAAGAPRVLVLEGQVRFSDGAKVQTLGGEDLEAVQMPLMSELSTGDGPSIAIERKFLWDLMTRLKGVSEAGVRQGRMKDGRPEGVAEIWSGETGLRERAVFEGGVLHGPYAAFFGDNRPEFLGRYERGLRAGSWTSYYENGKKADEGDYKDGRRAGLWKFYSSSGKLIREWNYSTQGDSAVPRWQWGLSYLGASQKQGSFHTGAGLITRCFLCDAIVAPRLEVTVSWLKFQEESMGVAFGAHAGLDFLLGPAVLRAWFGAEYLVRDPVRTSVGIELTRAVGRDMHSRDWQPFIRYSMIEMGAKSDISALYIGFWERF